MYFLYFYRIDCLTRQLKEAVILGGKPNSLNSKGEFGRCNIPRLTIEDDKYKQKVKELEGRLKEEEDDRKWKELVSRVRRNKPLKRKRGHSNETPPPTVNLVDRPVPPTIGPAEKEKTSKRQTAGTGTDNGPAEKTPGNTPMGIDIRKTQETQETDMIKVANVHASGTSDTSIKLRKNTAQNNVKIANDSSKSGEGGEIGEGGGRKETVRNFGIQTLASRKEENTCKKLERGRGEGTPKRKNENLAEKKDFESPAKKRRI